jgi:TonB dependent receptor
MRLLRYSPLVALVAACLSPQAAWAVATSPTPPAAPVAPSTDTLMFSANGSTLTDASGGGGGSIGWLHDFTAGVLGVSGEYQTLANAHWEFGSLTGSVSTGNTSAKWTFAADAHLGSGDIGVYQGLRRFNYDVEGASIAGTFGGKLTLQLDAQQYDVDTTHGTLPKVGLAYLWTPHWQTTASYARSATGNLGTELETLRIDHYGHTVNWLVGGASGHVAPAVVNLYTGILESAPQLREGYLGISKSFSGSDWSILGDYMKVANEKRITLTVVCALHVGR